MGMMLRVWTVVFQCWVWDGLMMRKRDFKVHVEKIDDVIHGFAVMFDEDHVPEIVSADSREGHVFIFPHQILGAKAELIPYDG